MELPTEGKCSVCNDWFNRPVQVDCVVFNGNKALVIQKKLEKDLSNELIHKNRLEYLLSKFKGKEHYYVLPGHAVRSGETLEEAVRRTLLEETGLLGNIPLDYWCIFCL